MASTVLKYILVALALFGAVTVKAQSTCAETSFVNEDLYGYYIPRSTSVLSARTITECCSLCYSSSTCYAWTFDTRPGPIFGCYLRTQAVRATSTCTSCISGVDSRVASLSQLSTVSSSLTAPINLISLNSTILTRSWTNTTTTPTSSTGSSTTLFSPDGTRGSGLTAGSSNLASLLASSSSGSGSGSGSSQPNLSGLGGGLTPPTFG